MQSRKERQGEDDDGNYANAVDDLYFRAYGFYHPLSIGFCPK